MLDVHADRAPRCGAAATTGKHPGEDGLSVGRDHAG
jgi:hypothetical protein